VPGREAGVVARKLNDGREFRIVKVFWDPQSLEIRTTALVGDAGAERRDYFIHGEVRPAAIRRIRSFRDALEAARRFPRGERFGQRLSLPS
jgi:hypothetical protein